MLSSSDDLNVRSAYPLQLTTAVGDIVKELPIETPPSNKLKASTGQAASYVSSCTCPQIDRYSLPYMKATGTAGASLGYPRPRISPQSVFAVELSSKCNQPDRSRHKSTLQRDRTGYSGSITLDTDLPVPTIRGSAERLVSEARPLPWDRPQDVQHPGSPDPSADSDPGAT